MREIELSLTLGQILLLTEILEEWMEENKDNPVTTTMFSGAQRILNKLESILDNDKRQYEETRR